VPFDTTPPDVPVFNEKDVVPALIARLRETLATLPGGPHEVVFVDDGSTDGTELRSPGRDLRRARPRERRRRSMPATSPYSPGASSMC